MSIDDAFADCYYLTYSRGTSAIAKAGDGFRRIVRQLGASGVREQAAKYLDLRNALETWYNAELLKSKRAIADPSLPSSVYADGEMSLEFGNASAV